MGFVVTATTGIRFVYLKKKMEMNECFINLSLRAEARCRGVPRSPAGGRSVAVAGAGRGREGGEEG